MKVSISVVIITFNEERNIERCIKSVLNVADEIFVLDSFSTDKTEEICKKYKVRFQQHAFDGHIEQKNRAAALASFDYVLSLDADEALSPELEASVLEVKKNWEADGYYFNRLTNYCGKWIKHSAWYPDRKLRLWNRKKGKWGGNNPHDKYIMKPGSVEKYIDGDLFHYSFYTIEQHMEQIDKFSTIKANTAFQNGDKSGYFKIFFNPIAKFIKHYFIAKGFLDGFFGLVISVNSAHSTFLKYVKLKILHEQSKKRK